LKHASSWNGWKSGSNKELVLQMIRLGKAITFHLALTQIITGTSVLSLILPDNIKFSYNKTYT
jgi:hypothetical protein